MGFARMLATLALHRRTARRAHHNEHPDPVQRPAVYDYAFDRYNAEDRRRASRARPGLDRGGAPGILQQRRADVLPQRHHDGLSTVRVQCEGDAPHAGRQATVVKWVNRVQELTAVYVLVYVVVILHLGARGQHPPARGAEPARCRSGHVAVGAVGDLRGIRFRGGVHPLPSNSVFQRRSGSSTPHATT